MYRRPVGLNVHAPSVGFTPRADAPILALDVVIRMMISSGPNADSRGEDHPSVSALVAEVEDALAARALGEDRVVELGRYRLVRIIGHGGMGRVFEAWDPQLQRHVAIKLVLEGGAQATLEEARCLARVAHPNVVCVHEVGHVGELVYIAMELVDGPDLRRWLQAAPREQPEIRAVVLAAGRGLAAVHDAGLLHGDVKPSNVLIGRDGRVRVADFGLARADASVDADAASSKPELDELVRRALAAVDEEPFADADWLMPGNDEVELAPADEGGIALDELRSLLAPCVHAGGTLPYMAPERRSGSIGGPAADQYSFCATVWEALFDQVPEPGVVCKSRGSVAEVLSRGLAEQPEARWPSMHDLCTELERAFERQQAWTGRWRGPLLASVLVGTVAGLAALYITNGEEWGAECQRLEHASARWGPTQREALETRFATSSLPRSEARFVSEQLDEYDGTWTAEWNRSCGSDPAMRRCLEHERQRFEDVLALLDSDESLAVARALVVELGSPTSCINPNREPSLDGPSIGGLAEISAIERRIQIAASSGAYELAAKELRSFDATVATSRSDPVELDLRRLAIGPLRARVLLATGQAGEARAALREAIRDAELRGDERLRFTLLLEQTRLAARVAAGSYEREAFGWQDPPLPDDDPALRESPTLDDLAALDGLAQRVEAGPVERAELSLLRAGVVIAAGAGDGDHQELIRELEAAGEELKHGHGELRAELALRRARLHFAAGQFDQTLGAAAQVEALAVSSDTRSALRVSAALTLAGASAAFLGDCARVDTTVERLWLTIRASGLEISTVQEQLRSMTEAINWGSVHRACSDRDFGLLVTGR
jgi:serine/threonine protein kinase